MKAFWAMFLAAAVMVALPGLIGAQTTSGGPGDKNAPQPPDVPGSINLTGGPDGFGYTFFDTNDGCPVFFQDISGTGTFLIAGDDAVGIWTLPFTFDFYGVNYTAVAASTNGYMSGNAGDPGTDFTNDCPIPAVPDIGGLPPRFYPYHDDLIATQPQGVYAQDFSPCPLTSPNFPGSTLGCTIVQWNNMQFFGGGPAGSFETILYDQSWEVVYQYASNFVATGASATIGIMNETSTIALQYSCNVASVGANFSICFTHPNGTPVTLESFEAKAANK